MCKIDERRRTEGCVAIDSFLRDAKKNQGFAQVSHPHPLQMRGLLWGILFTILT